MILPSAAGSIRAWLVDAAARIDAALGPARAKRIALPPVLESPGKEGEFCAVQLDDGSVGLAFVLLEGALPALHARGAPQAATAMDLVRGYAHGDFPARAVDLAATRAVGVPVTVLELRADLVREEPGLCVTLDPRRLEGCNKIVSTSTLLLNDTFEQISALWRGAQAVAIVGPSAGCPPDPLFEAGVSAVGGAWVEDAQALLARIEAGAKWTGAARKFTLARRSYPGLDALLRRVG